MSSINEPQNYGVEEEYQITPEEIKILIENIDVTILPNEIKDKEEIKLKEITNQILEEYTVAFGGLTDPIGQLQSWLADTLSGFSDWIVSSISNLIQNLTQSIIDTFNVGWQQITQSFQEFVVTPVTNVINEAINFISTTLPEQLNELINNLSQTISDSLASIQNIVGDISSGLQNLITQVSDIASQISESLEAIPSSIEDIINQILSSLQGITTQLSDVFKNIIENINNTFKSIQDIFGQLQSSFEGFTTQISGVFENITKTIQELPDTLKGYIDTISNFLGKIPSSIEEIIKSIQPTLEGIFKQITSTIENIPSVLGDIVQKISSSLETIPSTIGDYLGKLGDTFEQLIGNMGKSITNIIDTLKDFPKYVMSAVEDVQKWIWEQLPKEIKDFLATVPHYIAGIGDMWNNFVNAVTSFPDWFPKWFYEHISKPISDAIQGFSEWIWKNIPEPIKGFFSWIQEGWNNLVNTLKNVYDNIVKTATGLVKTLDWIKTEAWKTITSIPNIFQNIFNELSKAVSGLFTIADWIKTEAWKQISRIPEDFQKIAGWIAEGGGKVISDGVDTIANIYTAFSDLISKPDELFKKFSEYISGGLKWLGEQLSNFGEWIIGILEDMWSAFSGVIFHRSEGMFDVFRGAIKTFAEAMGKALKGTFPFFADLSTSFLKPIYDFFIITPSKTFSELVWKDFRKQIDWGKIMRDKKIPIPEKGEVEYIISLAGVPLLTLLGCRFLTGIIYSLSNVIPLRWELHLEPEALGSKFGAIETTIDLSIILKELAGVIGRLPKQTFNFMFQYLIYWYAQLYTKPLSAVFRDMIPIQIPRIDDLIEMLRRAMYIMEEKEETWKGFKEMIRNMLALYGYNTPMIINYTADIDEPLFYNPELGKSFIVSVNTLNNYIEYKDRFGKTRKMPLSLLYRIPDVPTLALFLLRDIFPDVDTFRKIVLARGVYEDTAYLYYLARFKYPTPERLYEFYARAEANMLWYKPPEEMMKKAQQEAESVGAFKPVAPINLNVTKSEIGKKIVSAITQYFKWHDYALWSWVKGFTSDAWLWIDLMAQIPLRVDARWMYKWMTFSAIYPQLQTAKKVTKVPLDEYNLGRVIIGRRTHPDFVPYVTIAEMMNALTEERTFFRTGILNAFRYNIMDIDTVKNIFAGMFKLTLHAPVYDHENHIYEWKQFTIPVRFLEGESKLMTLRAIYDRASRTYRDIQRTIFMMVTQNYDSPDKYSDYLQKLAEGINKVTKQIAKVYGLEAGFQLIFDKAYAEILNTSAKMRHSYNLMMRLRRWLWYSLYQLWYRFQRGYISDEELNHFVDELVKTMKLTEEEKNFFIEIAKFFRDIYRREYRKKAIINKMKKGLLSKDDAIKELTKIGIDEDTAKDIIESEVKIYVPTVSTLTTLAEVVPEALQLLDKVMEAQGIPEEERPLWKKYAIIKPLKDEASKLVTELITDYAKGIISQSEFRRYMDEMKTFGYSDEEIDLLTKLAELRRRRYAK